MRAGPRTLIHMGDAEVEYDLRFRLYLSTRLPNPHYLPEACAKVNLVNFAITRKGLEDQLLSELLQRDRPELEEARDRLVVTIASDKRQLQVAGSSRGFAMAPCFVVGVMVPRSVREYRMAAPGCRDTRTWRTVKRGTLVSRRCRSLKTRCCACCATPAATCSTTRRSSPRSTTRAPQAVGMAWLG